MLRREQDGFEDIWEHSEIRFDSSAAQLKPRRGEYLIDSINSVEDTKGNNGDRGSLMVTNLRVMWVSHKSSKVNLSVGFGAVQNISIRRAKSRLRGTTQALFVMTKYNNSRFEFIFTSLVKNSPRLFTTVQAVLRAYESTKLYRELKLRGSVVRDSKLLMLPREELVSKVDGVWNLSADQGNLGSFFVTNVRLVWHAHLAQNFNVSIPYMQMKSLRIRSSKFGQAFVIETSPKSGGYILGFRMEPQSVLAEVFSEVQSLHSIYSVCPIFGVEYRTEEVPDESAIQALQRHSSLDEDVEIIDADVAQSDAFAAYYAEGNKTQDRPIVFDEALGLAVESIPGDRSTRDLWRIL